MPGITLNDIDDNTVKEVLISCDPDSNNTHIIFMDQLTENDILETNDDQHSYVKMSIGQFKAYFKQDAEPFKQAFNQAEYKKPFFVQDITPRINEDKDLKGFYKENTKLLNIKPDQIDKIKAFQRLNLNFGDQEHLDQSISSPVYDNLCQLSGLYDDRKYTDNLKQIATLDLENSDNIKLIDKLLNGANKQNRNQVYKDDLLKMHAETIKKDASKYYSLKEQQNTEFTVICGNLNKEFLDKGNFKQNIRGGYTIGGLADEKADVIMDTANITGACTITNIRNGPYKDLLPVLEKIPRDFPYEIKISSEVFNAIPLDKLEKLNENRAFKFQSTAEMELVSDLAYGNLLNPQLGNELNRGMGMNL